MSTVWDAVDVQTARTKCYQNTVSFTGWDDVHNHNLNGNFFKLITK